MNQQIERTIPKVDDNYPGFCCQGHNYEICLIFPDKNVNYFSIWGACLNPDCPVHYVEPPEADMYRGVTSYLLEDFEERLEKVVTEAYNWHCSVGHNADFEVCENEICQRIREIEAGLPQVEVANVQS